MKMKTISYQKRQCRKTYRLHSIQKKHIGALSKSIHEMNPDSPGDSAQQKFSQVKFKTPSQYQQRIDWLD